MAAASADSALLVIARALWNPKATTDDKSERYLANALGYPRSWRVERRLEQRPNNTHQTMIVDRIYAGPKDAGVDTYFNHAAAQAAALEWVEGESTGYQNKGGQLLPRKPKFSKGDQVKVNYDGVWHPATIQKRTERREGYRYTVFYPEDNTTQTQVEEYLIDHMDDPVKVAEQLGLTGGWQAKSTGKKWKYIAPDGKSFTSKASALKHKKQLDKGEGDTSKRSKRKATSDSNEANSSSNTLFDLSDGDPPWRTTGHELLGRRVLISTQHQKSATRKITIDQEGIILGWIADTDVDTNGEPGFISEQTNQPANLFHVRFEDEPSHPYASLLVDRKDMEEYEVLECLVPVDQEEGGKKKKVK